MGNKTIDHTLLFFVFSLFCFSYVLHSFYLFICLHVVGILVFLHVFMFHKMFFYNFTCFCIVYMFFCFLYKKQCLYTLKTRPTKKVTNRSRPLETNTSRAGRVGWRGLDTAKKITPKNNEKTTNDNKRQQHANQIVVFCICI